MKNRSVHATMLARTINATRADFSSRGRGREGARETRESEGRILLGDHPVSDRHRRRLRRILLSPASLIWRLSHSHLSMSRQRQRELQFRSAEGGRKYVVIPVRRSADTQRCRLRRSPSIQFVFTMLSSASM